MKRLFTALAALTLAAPLFAQTPDVDGEVTKIDRAQSRLTLRHAEIKSLDMPPMTMVFRVRDPKALEGLAVGDKVRFAAEKVDGSYTVTAIRKAN
jgi:Cu/Ag efflux protein CusF